MRTATIAQLAPQNKARSVDEDVKKNWSTLRNLQADFDRYENEIQALKRIIGRQQLHIESVERTAAGQRDDRMFSKSQEALTL